MSLLLSTSGACKLNNSSDIACWAEMDITTYLGSCQYLKTVLPRAIATLLSRRIEFSKDYISHYSLQDVPYVGFRSVIPRNHCAYKILAAGKHLENFILQRHLKELVILLEYQNEYREKYVFKLSYNAESDGSFKGGQTAIDITAKFFSKINKLPATEKYKEHEIKLNFEWNFYDTVPKADIQMFFQPAKEKSDRIQAKFEVSNVQTPHHKLHIFMGYINDDE